MKPRVGRIRDQRSIGHSSTRSAGHGRVGLATAARDSIDVIIHLATALAVQYVYSNKNTRYEASNDLTKAASRLTFRRIERAPMCKSLQCSCSMEELNLSMVSFRSSIFERTRARPTPRILQNGTPLAPHPDAR